MSDSIQIKIDDKDVITRLDRAHEASDDLQPLFEKIGGALLFRTQRRFETESDPAGKKWPRLSPRTAAKRIGSRRRGFENMLRVKNRLYQSLGYQADPTSATLGTNVVYAAIQNFGGKIEQAERQHTIYQRYNEKTDTLDPRFVKRGRSNFARDVTIKARTINIPAREFLGFGDGDRVEVLKVTEDHFRTEGGFEGGGQ